MSYNDYAKRFSGQKIAEAYARFRHDYNAAVYDSIFEYCSKGNCKFELAIDVGCGSGQSTVPLSARFKQVIGIDVSEQQIKQTQTNSKPANISFHVGAAEDLSEIQDGIVDLITCAQSLHWMDLAKFYPQVARLLKPGGSFVVYGSAAFGNGEWELGCQEASDEVHKFYSELLGPYWGPERQLVEGKFSDLDMPFPDWIRPAEIWQEKDFTVDDFCGYLSSWAVYHKYKEDYPEDTELSALCDRLKDIYSSRLDPPGPGVMRVRWPVFLLMSRKPV